MACRCVGEQKEHTLTTRCPAHLALSESARASNTLVWVGVGVGPGDSEDDRGFLDDDEEWVAAAMPTPQPREKATTDIGGSWVDSNSNLRVYLAAIAIPRMGCGSASACRKCLGEQFSWQE